MKVIIAGSRALTNEHFVMSAINLCPFDFTEVVSGCASGVDRIGEKWADINAYPVTRFPANWDIHGKAAGPIRNKQMAEYADALLYIRYDSTPGTDNMIRTMTKLGKPVWGVTIASTAI